MAAPVSLPAVLWDEIQRAVWPHELQQLRIDLHNEVQQARADFAIEIQKVQTDLQKLRVEVVPELMREINQHRLDRTITAYKVVPFPNGNDPTQPPHNLPHLVSEAMIDQLGECELTLYLIGYCINPVPVGPTPRDMDYLRRDHLKDAIGARG